MTYKQGLVLVGALLALGLLQIACEVQVNKPPADPTVNLVPVTINNCQYLLLESGAKTNANYAFGFTHAGNCTNVAGHRLSLGWAPESTGAVAQLLSTNAAATGTNAPKK